MAAHDSHAVAQSHAAANFSVYVGSHTMPSHRKSPVSGFWVALAHLYPPDVIDMVAPGPPPTPLGCHRGLTVRPGVGTALAAVSRPGWGSEVPGGSGLSWREAPVTPEGEGRGWGVLGLPSRSHDMS